jgi:hypothetical protein
VPAPVVWADTIVAHRQAKVRQSRAGRSQEVPGIRAVLVIFVVVINILCTPSWFEGS